LAGCDPARPSSCKIDSWHQPAAHLFTGKRHARGMASSRHCTSSHGEVRHTLVQHQPGQPCTSVYIDPSLCSDPRAPGSSRPSHPSPTGSIPQ
jgi:hypothetical protein